MGAVRARKESPELVSKWEKLIKLLLKRQGGKPVRVPSHKSLEATSGWWSPHTAMTLSTSAPALS